MGISRDCTTSPVLVNHQSVPDELRERRQWVCWREEERDGKRTKVPKRATGKGNAASDDPQTWATFEQALRRFERGDVDGVGFVLTAEDPYLVVDLDAALSATGDLASWARDVVDGLQSWTERSPSGRGLHVWVRASLPEGAGNREDLEDGGRVEAYDRLRYMTVTGDAWPGSPLVIQERQGAVDVIVEEYLTKPATIPNSNGYAEPRPVNLDDHAILQLARRADNGAKFSALYDRGDTSAYHGDESRADYGLINLIRFWTDDDEARIDRLFRGSALYREKWDEVHTRDGRTYGELTISRALGRPVSDETYTPSTPRTLTMNGRHVSGPAPTAQEDLEHEEDLEPRRLVLRFMDCPALPDEAAFEAPAPRAGDWLDEYVAYGLKRSPMTPRLFHESGGLWLASVAIARRLHVDVGFGPTYPNLFAAWVAPTTLWHKTTAMDVPLGVARHVFPHLLTPEEVTHEALLSELGGEMPKNFEKMSVAAKKRWEDGRNFAAQKGWLLDELSGLLASAGRDYNKGLVESLMRMFDCKDYTRLTKGEGRLEIRNPYLCLLGATTPAAVAQHMMAEQLWAMGFWPRFALLVPDGPYPDWAEPQEAEPPAELEHRLHKLYNAFPAPTWPDAPTSRGVTMTEDAREAWRRYNRAVTYDLLRDGQVETKLNGSYGRLPSHALKVSTILAALEWAQEPGGTLAPRIQREHMTRALGIVETWRASAHRALSLASQSDFDDLRRRVLYQLARHEPTGASLRDLCQTMRDKRPDDLSDVLRQLADAEEVEAFEPTQKGAGRKTIRYRIAKSSQ